MVLVTEHGGCVGSQSSSALLAGLECLTCARLCDLGEGVGHRSKDLTVA